MTQIFQDPELERKYNEKIKERKELIAKQKTNRFTSGKGKDKQEDRRAGFGNRKN